jgi:PKD repeat protein
VTVGAVFSLRLSQLTAGPSSTVSVCMGDGSSNQSFTLTAMSYANMNYTYTTAGTYTIVVTPSTSLPGNVTTSINKIVVIVLAPGKNVFI